MSKTRISTEMVDLSQSGNNDAKIINLIGLPNSGKSTLQRKLVGLRETGSGGYKMAESIAKLRNKLANSLQFNEIDSESVNSDILSRGHAAIYVMDCDDNIQSVLGSILDWVDLVAPFYIAISKSNNKPNIKEQLESALTDVDSQLKIPIYVIDCHVDLGVKDLFQDVFNYFYQQLALGFTVPPLSVHANSLLSISNYVSLDSVQNNIVKQYQEYELLGQIDRQRRYLQSSLNGCCMVFNKKAKQTELRFLKELPIGYAEHGVESLSFCVEAYFKMNSLVDKTTWSKATNAIINNIKNSAQYNEKLRLEPEVEESKQYTN